MRGASVREDVRVPQCQCGLLRADGAVGQFRAQLEPGRNTGERPYFQVAVLRGLAVAAIAAVGQGMQKEVVLQAADPMLGTSAMTDGVYPQGALWLKMTLLMGSSNTLVAGSPLARRSAEG